MSPHDRLMKVREQMGHAPTTPALTFSKEDLVWLATTVDSLKVRRSAAEALYTLGKVDAARELRELTKVQS
jgi:hypothetical protein